MFKAIFWDNDGVLVDTEHLYYAANKQTVQPFGLELTDKLYHRYFLVESLGIWHLLAEQGMDESTIQRLRKERDELYSQLLAAGNLVIAGVEETLKQLHGRFQMGIVTSSQNKHFDIIHRNSGLLKYFDFVLALDSYQFSKPHPEPYLKAIERSGLPAHQCLVIEDSERGLIAAKAAGLQCWVIPSKLTRTAKFEGADRILNDITELVPALEGLARG